MRRIYYDGRRPESDEVFWFQDNRTGCEKQTVYFERIRQLDSELISKEQKNLVCAMERLRQLTYPRRKPVVLHKNYAMKCYTEMKFYKETSKNEKPQYLTKVTKQQRKKSAPSLNANQTGICGEETNDVAILRPKIESPFRTTKSLKSKETASHVRHKPQIDYTENSFFDNKPNSRKLQFFDVHFPSLPCIPNVGHRANIETESKLRILELANREFQNNTDFVHSSNISSRGARRIASEKGNDFKHKSEILDGDISNGDSQTPVLAAVFGGNASETELGESLKENNETRGDTGKPEVQTENLKSSIELDTSITRQPPPTRRSSQK